MIGVGLNLSIAPDEFPADLRQPAISLFGATGSRGESRRSLPAVAPRAPPTRRSRSLSRRLDHWVERTTTRSSTEWRAPRRRCAAARSAWEDGSGVADGIDDRGNLVVAVAGGGSVSLGAGEVHLRL